MTLLVQERYLNFDQETAYACALMLVVTAVMRTDHQPLAGSQGDHDE